MPVRVRSAVLPALLAGLVALPACKKQEDDGASGGALGLRSSNRNLLRQSQNNLKQIGLAFHNYYDNYNNLPVGIAGPDGKTPGLSWRVQILPYIEQDPLYRQFKLDEPWDSEHNKRLIPMMPKTYAAPETDPSSGLTYYRGFSGKGALFHPIQETARPGQPFAGGSLFARISDGTSNTALAVEAADAVPWTKPDELVFDPKGPVPGLGGVFRDGFNVLFCDASVRFLPGDAPPDALKAMITPNGGEVFALP
jgi:hypothetical protein